MFGRRLSPEHQTIVLKHRLRAEERELQAQARAEQKDRELQAKALADRQKADAARNAAIEKQHAEKERAWYSRPETEYQGGNNVTPDTFFVKHFAAPLPVAALPHPADPEYRAGAVWFAPGLMKHRNGNLQGDTNWMEQARETKKVWDSISDRYTAILEKLRDAAWWQRLCEDAGVCRSGKPEDLPWEGQYSAGTYKLTVVHVPTIKSVRIAEDGLRIVVRRNSDAARDWISKLDYLKAGFKSAGMNAAHLRVAETVSGDIELVFDDAPSSFPLAVCPTPPSSVVTSVNDAITRYERTRWMLGVDSRGKVISYPLKSQPHVLVTGGTGGGKSVWARSVIESLRTGYKDENGQDCGSGWLCWIGDGKGSDFAALEGQPGIAMVTPGSTDPAQVAVMVRRVRLEVERRYEVAGAAKKRGDTDAFAGMQPWLLLLDEWGSTAIKMTAQFGKSAAAFLSDIDIILRLGRECRVHCVLLSQTIRKTGDGAVPGSWQENLGLTVSLGSPSDITLQSEAFTPETRERAALLGSRLKGKQGRGLTADRETGAVIEFQSFYGWSPGTTSLDHDADKKVQPPTPELRELWAQWKPISAVVPWLAPRVGIKVPDAEWRGDAKADLNDIANTPTITLTDRDGNLRPGMERYDPASPEWLGKKRIGGASGVYTPISFDDEPVTAPAPSAVPVPTESEPAAGAQAEPDPLDGVSPEELAAALALIKKSRATVNEPSTAPRTAQAAAAAAADPGDAPTPASGRTPREPQGTEQPTTPPAPAAGISYAEDENEW